MAVLLGGRAAEMLAYGRPSTGAADDLAKATEIARAMVTRYGMHAKLGLVTYEEEHQAFLAGTLALPAERRYSEETAREIDVAVREAVQAAFDTASGVLRRARPVLEHGARLLLEKETLGEIELGQLGKELTATLSGAACNAS
jgi:cell division protease FtsH